MSDLWNEFEDLLAQYKKKKRECYALEQQLLELAPKMEKLPKGVSIDPGYTKKPSLKIWGGAHLVKKEASQ